MTASIGDSIIKLFFSPTTPLFKKHSIIKSLSSSYFSQIGQQTGLRVTAQITSSYQFRGYCLGGTLVMTSCYLRQHEEVDVAALNSSYSSSIGNVILLQKLHEQLMGTRGRCSKKLSQFFGHMLIARNENGAFTPLPKKYAKHPDLTVLYEAAKDYLTTTAPQCSLKKHVIEFLESKDIFLSPNLYTLVLEICGYNEKIKTPLKHRFHTLQEDVLKELTALCYMSAEVVFSGYGDTNRIVRSLEELPSGAYHLSFAQHSCAYLKRDENDNWLWDISKGFKKIESSKKLARALNRSATLTTNWITIHKLLKKEG